MIFDKISNIENYRGIDNNLDLAIDTIIKGDYIKAPLGKNIIVENEVFYNVQEYTTKNIENCFFETHKKYLDIQLIVSGEENIGSADNEVLEITNTYNEEKDIEKLQGISEIMFKMKEDNFIMFFSGEPHMPSMKVKDNKEVKKVVFKVEVK